MTRPPIRAACGDCGQSYRVPAAGRTYRCKACGGEVRAQEEQHALAPVLSGRRPPAEVRRKPARTRPAPGPGEAAPVRRRGRRLDRSGGGKRLWLGIGAAAVLAALGLVGLQRVRAGEPDLEAVAERFSAAWNDDATSPLVGMAHPEVRDELRARLALHRKTRGWEEDLPTIAGTLTDLRGLERLAELQPTDKAPTTTSTHGFGGGRVTVTWQYNPSNTTWYVIDLELTAPAIGHRAEGFRQAWERSDPAALVPFLGSSSAEKTIALVERETAKRAWTDWPPLGEPRLSREPAGDLLWSLQKVDVTYPTPRGELLTRWRLDLEADAWVVSGFDFPDG